MASYYVNKSDLSNPNNNHEVHKEGCYWMPSSYNCEYLGEYSSGVPAVAEAKRRGYSDADGCKTCCPEAHHR